MNRPQFVTSTLSRGLAKDGLATLEAQGVGFISRLPRLGRPLPMTKKKLRQSVDEVVRLGEAACLVQVVGQTPNKRDASTSVFVPYTLELTDLSVRKCLRFYLMQTTYSTRRGIRPGSDSGDVIEIDEHAIERLFLRLRTLELRTVSDELRDAMLLALPLVEVAERLGLRQVALPTSNGAFLCQCDPEDRLLLGKTWLPTDTTGPRWNGVCGSIREACDNYGGEVQLARLLGAGIKRSMAENEPSIIAGLTRALSRIHWLTEPYLPRPDPLGQVWNAAKRQAVATNWPAC